MSAFLSRPEQIPVGRPCLSVLVPTYNQPDGIARIFASLRAIQGHADIEIIVSDDSSNDAAAKQIAVQCAAFGSVRYLRNQPALGAVPNWNRLLDLAVGGYCLLLHHDEEIAAGTDLPALLLAMQAPCPAHAWVLACRVIRKPSAPARLHFPAPLAAYIARHYPAYLLRRNLIGPPSALVVQRSSYLRFDTRLRWLVDVDAYCRIFQQACDVRAWPNGGVISRADALNSITAKLAPQVAQIAAAERQLLASRYSLLQGFSWLFKDTRMARTWRVGEAGLWWVFRSSQRLLQWLAIFAGFGRR